MPNKLIVVKLFTGKEFVVAFDAETYWKLYNHLGIEIHELTLRSEPQQQIMDLNLEENESGLSREREQ